MHNQPVQVVYTNKARCRDCYRCLRVCPVKAIRMRDGQAFVVEDRCIACGTCMRNCPQGAKSFRRDLPHAVGMVEQGLQVAASVAPSFAAAFSEWQRARLPSALRKLGFSYVAETAVGAYHVARKTAELAAAQPGGTHVCSACPAAFQYVERYLPQLVANLLPIASPMVVHARQLKASLGSQMRVVFIGPCVAKKAEADRPEHRGIVDCVLTFEEVMDWLSARGIRLEELEESQFDETPGGWARSFPLEGGSARTASLTTDILADDVLAVSGAENVIDALNDIVARPRPVVLEALMCPHGCINGPAMPADCGSVLSRRSELLAYATLVADVPPAGTCLDASFAAAQAFEPAMPSEDRIREVLEQTGRARPENQLNCGACGYASCREKAVAVIQGMAELEMCMPRMRHLAERRTDRIIETSPNGIVILDEQLSIISMNPAFRRFFMAGEALLGKPISTLMDPDAFERLATGSEQQIDVVRRHDKYNLLCREILYPLREERQYVGLFVNITAGQVSQAKLDELRSLAVTQAQELLNHQVQMAQTIAQFLGESTARSEELVESLMKQAREEPQPRRKDLPWGTSTSK